MRCKNSKRSTYNNYDTPIAVFGLEEDKSETTTVLLYTERHVFDQKNRKTGKLIPEVQAIVQ